MSELEQLKKHFAKIRNLIFSFVLLSIMFLSKFLAMMPSFELCAA